MPQQIWCRSVSGAVQHFADADAIISRFGIAGHKEENAHPTLLITADTVVVYEGTIREKPSSKEEARHFVKGYSGGCAIVVGSVVVTNLTTGIKKRGWDRSEVYFHDIPDEIIDKLVDDGVTLNVAGGLMLEHPLTAPFVDTVIGTADGVMGLSKSLTEKLLKESLDELTIFTKVCQAAYEASRPKIQLNPVERDRYGAHNRLVAAYFSEHPQYEEATFRTRFRMSRKLFTNIVRKCTSAIRQMAYGAVPDALDENLQMAPDVPFVANNVPYKMGYYLTDGIYLQWSVLIKSIKKSGTNDHKRILYKTKHEAARKDVKRAFGVLKKKWKLLKHSARGISRRRLSNVMYTCIILHHMIIHDNETADVPNDASIRDMRWTPVMMPLVMDPEHPYSLEQLNVLSEDSITVDDKLARILITFTPTIQHCSMATVIGLCLRVKLKDCFPSHYKVDIKVAPGSHADEEAVNKQLNDKERVVAAMENPNLRQLVDECLHSSEL
nr:maf-like protein isoform X1 [Tanacetum cinerariifolium]